MRHREPVVYTNQKDATSLAKCKGVGVCCPVHHPKIYARYDAKHRSDRA